MNTLRNLLYALLGLLAALSAALGQENSWDGAYAPPGNTNWSWTAPAQPLPDTWYWDYGWDSTSNGVPPAENLPSTMIVSRRTRLIPLPPFPPIPVRVKATGKPGDPAPTVIVIIVALPDGNGNASAASNIAAIVTRQLRSQQGGRERSTEH